MVKIKWSDVLNPGKKIAINCQTEEEAKEYLRMLDARGVVWPNRNPLTETTFFRYGEDTCYRLREYGLCYSSSRFYENDGSSIYRYSNVEFVDDVPEKQEEQSESNEEQAVDLKAEALCNIVKAMTEIRCNMEEECDGEQSTLYAVAMKALAEAFEIVSRS